MGQYHVAITRHVKPGKEQEFAAALREFAQASLAVPGTLGVHLIGPVPGSGGGEFGILRTFEDEAASRAFYASPLFADWEQRAAPLAEAATETRQLHGLEAFFRDGHRLPPPRWKMALLTWMGVFPCALLWSKIVRSMLTGFPELAAFAVANVLVVITLAWLVMPLLTTMFANWLHPAEH
jgi:antibiotic biosynthesis monooxygenase (ABM) superfamily enzyme